MLYFQYYIKIQKCEPSFKLLLLLYLSFQPTLTEYQQCYKHWEIICSDIWYYRLIYGLCYGHKVLSSQSYGFSSSHAWMFKSWTIKKAEHQRIDGFELWRWRRLLRVPWTARKSNQSILKEISPEYSLEELMLKQKLQYLGHLMRRTDSLKKPLSLGKIEDRRRRGWQRMRWLEGITDSMEWVWANSRSWWWTGKPGVLQSVGLQRVGHNWVTELNWWLLPSGSWQSSSKDKKLQKQRGKCEEQMVIKHLSKYRSCTPSSPIPVRLNTYTWSLCISQLNPAPAKTRHKNILLRYNTIQLSWVHTIAFNETFICSTNIYLSI